MKLIDISEFVKQHQYLICIDSDGTAIDAMNAKHKLCHGPAFIEQWNLDMYRDEIQAKWNQINLLRESRGVNRFIALVEMLTDLEGTHTHEPELPLLKTWVETTNDLSNTGLQQAISKNENCPLFSKALAWSNDINQKIATLSYLDKPAFEGVKECLDLVHHKADIAVVSSSNITAIYEEWKEHGLLEYVDVMTSQEIGTKSECIRLIMEKGYQPQNVMMIGDAYPDVDAANDNNIFFYPIMLNKEEQSWNKLKKIFFPLLLTGKFDTAQEQLLQEFKYNFTRNGEDENES
ncbi:MAG: HAD family hydrolase [Candidatus Izemoplasmataceae bacterium]